MGLIFAFALVALPAHSAAGETWHHAMIGCVAIFTRGIVQRRAVPFVMVDFVANATAVIIIRCTAL